MNARIVWVPTALFLLATSTRADIIVPGANGSDGALTIGNATIDLSQAPTGAWDSVSTQPGKGVYDPEKWAVVFKYTSVSVAGTLRFTNSATRAPVVWLVNGNVSITGSVIVSASGTNPGPGGFRGTTGGGGFGPGGPDAIDPLGDPASFGTLGTQGSPGKLYGNSRIIPLIGGSGGSFGPQANYASGGGGGAILIAATGTITINGVIQAWGGAGAVTRNSGSGGAIRLVADTVTGTGKLDASGGYDVGGAGRIRIEANNRGSGLTITPVASGTSTVTTAQLWPDASAATARIVSVGNETVPADPKAAFNVSDVAPDVSSTLPVVIATTNVPTTATVNLRVVPVTGAATTVKATLTSGDQNAATWTAQIVPVAGTTALLVRVEAP